jgi:hypothetical protein
VTMWVDEEEKYLPMYAMIADIYGIEGL